MAMYRVCEYCGANLDPGERCDCKDSEVAGKEFEGKTTGGGRHAGIEGCMISLSHRIAVPAPLGKEACAECRNKGGDLNGAEECHADKGAECCAYRERPAGVGVDCDAGSAAQHDRKKPVYR